MVDIKFEDAISGSTRLKSMKNFLNKTKNSLRETTARCGAIISPLGAWELAYARSPAESTLTQTSFT